MITPKMLAKKFSVRVLLIFQNHLIIGICLKGILYLFNLNLKVKIDIRGMKENINMKKIKLNIHQTGRI